MKLFANGEDALIYDIVSDEPLIYIKNAFVEDVKIRSESQENYSTGGDIEFMPISAPIVEFSVKGAAAERPTKVVLKNFLNKVEDLKPEDRKDLEDFARSIDL